MHLSRRPNADEVEQLLLNARLRDELEPFYDESIEILNVRKLPTIKENEFLASLLAWERAPTVPISQWFDPELKLPTCECLSEGELRNLLWSTIHRLYEKRIVLEFTDHLSDRQLYCMLVRDILPSPEKKIELPKNYLHWHCLDEGTDAELWLRYYASNEEREAWGEETQQLLPPQEDPPFPRKMPRRALE